MLTRARAALAVVATVATVLVTLTTVDVTAAAWTDPVNVTAAASAGTWAAPPATSGCVVLTGVGNVDPSTTCSIAFGADTDGRPDYFNIKATVTTTSATPVRWRATINFSNTAVFGFVARFVGEYAGNWSLQALPANFCTTVPRVVSYEGNASRGTNKVVAGTPLTLDFVGTTVSPVGNYVVYSCP